MKGDTKMDRPNTLVTAEKSIISWLNKCNIDVLADIADSRKIAFKIKNGRIIEVHKE